MTANTPYNLPAYVIDRVMKKRGRLHVYDRFDPAQTALVVIDMQKFYLDDVKPALDIIPTINRLAGGFRAKGASVAWVSMSVGQDGKSLWPLYHDNFFLPEGGAKHRDQLTPGVDGHLLHPELDVQEGDIHASKNRFSAFIPGASDLHELLGKRGIKNVAIAGVVTNFCCETSARDAMMLDYRVAMIFDANAARFEEDHQIGFSTVFQNFGDIYTADEMLKDVLR